MSERLVCEWCGALCKTRHSRAGTMCCGLCKDAFDLGGVFPSDRRSKYGMTPDEAREQVDREAAADHEALRQVRGRDRADIVKAALALFDARTSATATRLGVDEAQRELDRACMAFWAYRESDLVVSE